MKQHTLSKIRAAAGRAGAEARWGKRRRATKTVRVFTGDAAKLDELAASRRKRVADVVHEMLRRP